MKPNFICLDFIPEWTTFVQILQMEILKKLIDAAWHKRGTSETQARHKRGTSEAQARHVVEISLHDSLPRQGVGIFFSSSVAILSRKIISAPDQPPCSPGLAAADFLSVPELMAVFKGKGSSDVDDIKSSVKTLMTDILLRPLRALLTTAEGLGKLETCGGRFQWKIQALQIQFEKLFSRNFVYETE
jgi:hypothetical protein